MTTINDPKLRVALERELAKRVKPRSKTRVARETNQYATFERNLHVVIEKATEAEYARTAQEALAALKVAYSSMQKADGFAGSDPLNLRGKTRAMLVAAEQKLKSTLLAPEKRESGRWRPVNYKGRQYYVFEIRGGMLLLSERPNDTLWVHKVDPSKVEYLPWYGDIT